MHSDYLNEGHKFGAGCMLEELSKGRQHIRGHYGLYRGPRRQSVIVGCTEV